jgi:UDP-N-acetylglucosamine--N-acetylmuramyl-(pentapeptide) pyrophosphoryl-undecaprenol N-acetylglucosamine transferase
MPIADTPRRGHIVERLAIAGGGTLGHVYPAVALAETLRAAHPGIDVLFIGTATGDEARIAAAHEMRFAAVTAAPFYGAGRLDGVRAVAYLARGAVQARRVLRRQRVQLVLGLGAFASAGVVIAGWSLGLPTLIHEANATAGLTNRLLGRIADRILVGFASAADDFPPGRSLTTGMPVPRAFHDAAKRGASAWTRTSARPFRLLIMGGSRGSTFLNARAPELVAAIGRLGIPVAVHHQTGIPDLGPVRAAYARAGVTAEVVSFIDDAATVYARADFAITCAGAATLAELAAVGLPALLVPLASAARDHQVANARAFAETSHVWWTTERTWDTTMLAQRCAALAADPTAWREASARMGRAATPAAAMQILAACEELCSTGGGAANTPAFKVATR